MRATAASLPAADAARVLLVCDQSASGRGLLKPPTLDRPTLRRCRHWEPEQCPAAAVLTARHLADPFRFVESVQTAASASAAVESAMSRRRRSSVPVRTAAAAAADHSVASSAERDTERAGSQIAAGRCAERRAMPFDTDAASVEAPAAEAHAARVVAVAKTARRQRPGNSAIRPTRE